MPSAWEQGRPIYKRLPIAEEKYQVSPDDPELDPVADWLTLPIDEYLMAAKEAVDNFYTDYLDPVTAKTENLDWLGQLCGFTGEYWETSWSQEQKRSLITNAFTFIWESKGTRAVLEFLHMVFS
ncbi:hypothetical protein VF07_22420 [Nostoc linckia z6]|uniref:phage tail protein n=1 Tax=Nostoc linckia TaxID=92942 RepID=UPI000BFFFF44|nr:phage tail protein [Nostoc linckia]PHJ86313.1 hypothetical protein VF07_22420 [Nostoc linckia z6]